MKHVVVLLVAARGFLSKTSWTTLKAGIPWANSWVNSVTREMAIQALEQAKESLLAGIG